jgi:hypothetical protein
MDDIFTALPDRYNPYSKAGLLAYGQLSSGLPSACQVSPWQDTSGISKDDQFTVAGTAMELDGMFHPQPYSLFKA